MGTERTLAILEPDCVRKQKVGEVDGRMQDAGVHIQARKMVTLSKAEAEGFYAVHEDKPFFDDLTDFMSSGPCVPVVLEQENAIEDFRPRIGAHAPDEAEEGTIRSASAG